MANKFLPENEQLKMFLRVASAHEPINSHLLIAPEGQTTEILTCLQGLVEDGLVNPFHTNTPSDIEAKIHRLKMEEAVPIEQILLTGMPIPQGEGYYDLIRDNCRKLEVCCSPYGNALKGTLSDQGLVYLGYHYNGYCEKFRHSDVLELEESLCYVALEKSLANYKPDYVTFSKEKMLETLKSEQLVEGDIESTHLTKLGQEIQTSLLQIFNLFRNAEYIKKRWKDAKY